MKSQLSDALSARCCALLVMAVVLAAASIGPVRANHGHGGKTIHLTGRDSRTLLATGRDSRTLHVTGTVISIAQDGRSFLLQRERERNRTWNVLLEGDAKIKLTGHAKDEDRDDDEDDDRGKHGRHRHGHDRAIVGVLQVGDIVRVQGRFIGASQILARDVTVVERGAVFAPVTLPPFGGHFPLVPEIFSPQNGSVIAGSEFTIIGRTLPETPVHIEVAGETGIFRLPVATADVLSDRNGFFTHTVALLVRVPNTTFRITVQVKPRGGAASVPVSITVRMR